MDPLASVKADEPTQPANPDADIEPAEEEGGTDATTSDLAEEATEVDQEQQQEEEQTNDETEPEGETQSEGDEEAPAASTLDEDILAAVKESGAEESAQKAIAKMAKRIKSFKDERDAERNERLRLQQEIAELKGKPPAEATAAPAEATAHPALAAIDQEIKKLEDTLEIIEGNPDGYSWTNKEGETQSLTAEELRALKPQYSRRLRALEAKRASEETQLAAQIQQRRQAAAAQARQLYPWVNQKDSPEYKLAVQSLNAMGPVAARQLAENPEFELIMGRFITGLLAEQKAGKKPGILPAKQTKGGAPGRRPPANVVPGPGLRGGRLAGLQRELKAAEAELERTGSADAYVRVEKLEQRIAAAAAS